jgi:hypothetical protein
VPWLSNLEAPFVPRPVCAKFDGLLDDAVDPEGDDGRVTETFDEREEK